jgi:hypothetical protein
VVAVSSPKLPFSAVGAVVAHAPQPSFFSPAAAVLFQAESRRSFPGYLPEVCHLLP